MNAAWYKVLNALLNTSISFLVLALIALSPSLQAQIAFDGFLQGLFGGRLDGSNPTATEYTASETRLQLRAEHVGDRAVFFGRLDFIWDGADTAQYRWEFREGYMKFSVGSHLDFKVGRQTLTWGTGDLVFINDVFAKDYESFFIGRDDQYLKAPQNTLRAELYSRVGTLSLVWSPRFEPNRLPTGRRLSYFNPMADSGAGAIVGEGYFFQAALPENRFKNGELAARLQKDFGSSTAAVYFYRGFYKDPLGFDATTMVP
ncbi:MAG TPA: hypothetical protein VN285_00320, partial [Candidatus Deferrimicrobium sp.]|nr:hypothetical protein [Candidatus Deferrimicrobium sp.]